MTADRDRRLEQALKRQLQATGQARVSEACLDAETLAAWMDGGLDAAAMAATEAHVSTCAHCQALLGTFSRTAPLAPGALGTQGTSGTFRPWRWWLAPVAAAAAAVVIWAVVPQQSIAPVAPPATAPPAAQAARARENAPTPVPETPPRPLEREQTFAGAPRRDASRDPRELRKEADPRMANAAPPPVAMPPPAPAPAAPSPAAVADSAALRQEKAIARAAELGAAAAPTAQMRARDAAAVEIATPDPSRRWRIGADQGIERSDDSGRTWRQVRAAQGDTIVAGSAPSSNVCWFVGANGLVLVTTDGNAFTRAAAPAPVDLIRVAAADARTATVTSDDGRTFRTDDGGRTWRQ